MHHGDENSLSKVSFGEKRCMQYLYNITEGASADLRQNVKFTE